jgi:hypothetical protein
VLSKESGMLAFSKSSHAIIASFLGWMA